MPDHSLNLEALVAALDAKRDAEQISWRELARQVGVSPSTLTRMQQGKRPDVDTLVALVRWLNMRTEDFLTPDRRTTARPHPAASVASMLRGQRPESMTPDIREAIDELVKAAIKLSEKLGKEKK